MIIIALASRAEKAAGFLSKDSQWCYLGKDIARRERIARALPKERRLYLKARVYEITEKLSRPYLDFVARAGEAQADKLNWWASKFASKSHIQSDFLLFLSYKVVIAELLQRKINSGSLVIFIEDAWLFTDIRNTYKGEKIQYIGGVSLFLVKVLCLIRGIVHRLLLPGWIILARLLILYYHRGKKPEILQRRKDAVVMINPAEPRAFKQGRYVDNYMPGLAAFYREKGIGLFYLYLFRFPLATAKYTGINKEILWPLILDLKFPRVIERICASWRPQFKRSAPGSIAGYNVSLLLQREEWLEFSSAGFNFHLLLSDALNCFFRKGWCRSLIYTFENQPWEKILCMAADENNVRLIGYQHSSIWRLFLAQFIGKGEEGFIPLPEKIVASGDYFAGLYRHGGMPGGKIIVGGAWRYAHMADSLESKNCSRPNTRSRPVILIPLCLDVFMSQSMLENFFKAVAEGAIREKIEVWIKLHPGNTKSELNRLNRLIGRYPLVNKPFAQLYQDIDIVICSSSTIGLEAFFYGKKVVSYMPENLLAANPLLDIEDERIYKWYEGESLDVDFLRDCSPPENTADYNRMKEEYFSKIKRSVWLELVGSKTRREMEDAG